MKSFLLILILIVFCRTGISQVVSGYIMDKNSRSRISFATVYINGTYVGTSTDQNGFFTLDISKKASMPLTVSALGYYSVTLGYYSTDTLNQIYLTPKVFELSEVVVTGKGDAGRRKENLSRFRNDFLGTSTNSKNCEIINEDDIRFSFDPSTGIFKAFSVNPIKIINKNLGYKIIYFLDKYEFIYPLKGPVSGSIIGNYQFIEDTLRNKSSLKRIEERRKFAYLGSRMHFFRELWRNNLVSAGFEMKDSLSRKIGYKKIVVESRGESDPDVSKYLNYYGKIYIGYRDNLNVTIIKINKDHIFFNKDGFFDPLGIVWEGDMSYQRIGDLLPFEYSPGSADR
jgi:hypothetical protein